MKRSEIFIVSLIFMGMLLVFIPDFFGASKSLVLGDYGVQHYPWAKYYANMLKQFSLPGWCPEMQMGFPLLAEGQIGVFYPLNILLFFLFPFHWAYNLSILIHFFIGALFFYFFARYLSLSPLSAWVGAIIWIFGSAYAGIEYNLMSMRVLVWMPLTFLLSEKILKNPKIVQSLFLGSIFFIQWVAGFTQFAFYSIGLTILYFLVNFTRVYPKKYFSLIIFGIGFISGLGLAMVQLWPSLELSQSTLRFLDANIDFAMLGKFPIFSLFSAFFPYATGVLSGFRIYVGTTSLFFIVVAYYFRKHNQVNLYFIFSVLLLFCAVGFPLYGWMIQIFGLYYFRTPAKLTLFVCFFLALLVAHGIHFFSENSSDDRLSQSKRMYMKLCTGMTTVFVASHFFLKYGPELLKKLGHFYVDRFIVNHLFHQRSSIEYYEKVNAMVTSLQTLFSFTWQNVCIIFFMGVGCVVLFSCYRYKKYILASLICVELFFFSFYGTGLRGNISRYAAIDEHELQRLFLTEKKLFRIYWYAENQEQLDQLGISPNQNMLYGISAVGAYSPLIAKSYAQFMDRLGNFDDSLGYHFSQKDLFFHELHRLSLSNVKYIYSPKELTHPTLKKVMKTPRGNYLYLNEKVFPRFYFIPEHEQMKASDIEVQLYTPQEIKLHLNVKDSGWIGMSEFFFPGWKAWVDGEPVVIEKTQDIFRKIHVPKGNHTVICRFESISFYKGIKISCLSLGWLLLMLVCQAGCTFQKNHPDGSESMPRMT